MIKLTKKELRIAERFAVQNWHFRDWACSEAGKRFLAWADSGDPNYLKWWISVRKSHGLPEWKGKSI